MSESSPNIGIQRRAVPVRLRSSVAFLFQLPLLRQMGTVYYSRVTNNSAKIFQESQGVRRVILYGGALRNCQPGISDLDFLVIVEKQNGGKSEISQLETLQRSFTDLQRRYLIPGEVMIMDEDTLQTFVEHVSPFPFMSGEHAVFESGAWRHAVFSPQVLSYSDRLSHGLHFFSKAQGSFSDWLKRPNHLALQNFKRSLGKANALIEYFPSVNSKLSPADQLAETFVSLDSLALEVLQEQGPIFSTAQLILPPLRTNVSEIHLAQTMSKPELSRLFCQLAKEDLTVSRRLLSETMYKAFIQKALWKSPTDHLYLLTQTERDDEQWVNRFKGNCFNQLRARFVSHLVKLTGQLISYPLVTIQKQLQEICLEALVLESNCLTAETSVLLGRSRKQLPLTTALYEKLLDPKLAYSFISMAEVLAVREEMKSLFLPWQVEN